ncbi:MAG: transcriptional repressor LexA [Actinomycetaceae bacterium]|nr:transcriptional repressor LexA [Actinomycetaceae bacterium]
MTDSPNPRLTARQEQILRFLSDTIAERGFPPSVRELAQAVGLSSASSVKHQLDALEDKGYIRRTPRLPRALEILIAPQTGEENQSADNSANALTALTYHIPAVDNDEGPTTQAPLVGRIAAGEPITAEQSVDDVFTLPQRFTGRGELFVLEVSGMSMVDAAICDGDYVVVRRQPTALDGEIVAAMIEGEATVKVLAHRDGHQWLDPRNQEFSPIPADEATILGKVVTVIRTL